MDLTNAYFWIYLEINIACCLGVMMMMFRMIRLGRSTQDYYFAWTLSIMPFVFLSDSIWQVMNDGMFTAPVWVMLLCKYIYFLAVGFMCFGWFMYFEYVIGSSLLSAKWKVYSAAIGIYIYLALIVSNPWTHLLFYYEGSVYRRGPLFSTLYLLTYLYVLIACVHSWFTARRDEHLAERRFFIIQSMFPIPPAIAGGIQFAFPSLPVLCVCLFFSSLIMYLNAIEEMISQDPLTGLSNRRKILQTLLSRLKGDPEHLYLLMIDVNSFKKINDTYGHPEGDRALQRVSRAMKSACDIAGKNSRMRPSAARSGGDEFMIVAVEDSDKAAETLKDLINEELERLNKEDGAKYSLTVSIGIQKGSEGITAQKLISQSDVSLYDAKQKFHEHDH